MVDSHIYYSFIVTYQMISFYSYHFCLSVNQSHGPPQRTFGDHFRYFDCHNGVWGGCCQVEVRNAAKYRTAPDTKVSAV